MYVYANEARYRFRIEIKRNINVMRACNVIHVLRRLIALLLFHNGAKVDFSPEAIFNEINEVRKLIKNIKSLKNRHAMRTCIYAKHWTDSK
jgi:hypothetical protein